MLPANDSHPIVAQTLDELLGLQDRAFVDCAYRTILKRPPDPQGLAHYLAHIRKGIPKTRILMQLRHSREGKRQALRLKGLDAAIRRYRRTQWVFVGGLFRMFDTKTEGDRAIDRSFRVLENRNFLLGEESARRFDRLEKGLASLYRLVETRPHAAVQDHTPKQATNIFAQSPESEDLDGLSPRARDIYFQLKSAAILNDKEMT